MSYEKSNAGKKNTIANTTSMGYGNANLITDTEEHVGNYRVLVFLSDTTFTTLTTTSIKKNGGSFAVAGDWGTILEGSEPLTGEFTNIKLTSGSVLAYEEAEID